MTLKQYLAAMSLGTILCWVTWWLLISGTDPTVAPWFVFFFFYASLFLALLGTFTLLGFLWRISQQKHEEVLFRHVRKTFRQGVFFAFLVSMALYLKSNDLFNWWSTLLLILFLVTAESIFLSRNKPHTRI